MHWLVQHRTVQDFLLRDYEVSGEAQSFATYYCALVSFSYFTAFK